MNFFYISLSFFFNLFSFHKKKKKKVLQDLFFVPYLYYRITFSVGLNCDQMEEGEQYSEYYVERNPIANMSMMAIETNG